MCSNSEDQAEVLSPDLIRAKSILQDVFGYQQFRQGQQQIIAATLQGQSSFILMATGGGKSLCYQIPALCFPGLTLVVSPLIALMQDQVDQLTANGVAAAYLNSSQTLDQQREIEQQALSGKLKLLYISPEKVMTTAFFYFIQQCQVSFIAIDEAHCISQWGHDFRPEYSQLRSLTRVFPHIPIMALTATADRVTREDILELLNLQQPFVYIGSFDRPNIRYTVVEKFKPQEQLLKFVKSQKGKSGIIYANSRNKVERLAEMLQRKGISAKAYHAGFSNEIREQVQHDFQRDNIQIIVATIAFGMGINKPNIRFVLHYDLPRSIEAYYQETGRAGRDDLPAEAVLFYDHQDYLWLNKLLQEKPDSSQKMIEQHKLQAMGEFAEAQTCRRLVLLNYFAEHRHQPCNNCDICLNPPKKYDGLIDAQKILSTVYRTGQKFGSYYVIAVLRGVQNQKIQELQHDKLSVFGIGKDKSQEYWHSVIRQLIHLGFLSQNIANYSALQLTEAARPILRGEMTLSLATPRQNLSMINHAHHYQAQQGDRELFNQLRKLRKQLSDRDNIPPYAVFNDATLEEMAREMPTTLSEMLQINGVGFKKLERYAQPFLAVILRYLENKK
ncbi:ATP-dependent DNA helicase RecQ [Gallibacterium anatis]|uniref:DNA helicase RecQ n=1 Tax=Gallibacterium anatis TaxID=750 RepID=UPI000532149A|nr:DNA helicase RecQ [Gallibacterium anatis]KGQ41487.1 ATP-dependent DNA helicase RecQ [Gallibacterium anatis]